MSERKAWKQQLFDRLTKEIDNDETLSHSWNLRETTNEEREEELHIYKSATEGIKITLNSVLKRIEEDANKADEIIDDLVGRITKTLQAAEQEKDLKQQSDKIFPVLRSASFPKEKKDGTQLIHQEHTPESVIFYALDLEKSYVLIDEKMMADAGWSQEQLHQQAVDNLTRLDVFPKEDEVQGNTFYFFSQKDGYAASRVLNESLIKGMRKKIKGDMGIAIPHQDVLVIADLQNKQGFQIISKLNMDFCMKGEIPISPLPFLYKEDGKLDPIMILNNPGKSAPTKRK